MLKLSGTKFRQFIEEVEDESLLVETSSGVVGTGGELNAWELRTVGRLLGL